MGHTLVEGILKQPPVHQGTILKEKRYTTLHNRGATDSEFYIVARFIHGLTHVIAPEYKIPLVLDLGRRELRLPVWSKDGEGWHRAGYEFFREEALGIMVPMMRAIERYTGIAESSTLNSLHSFSMVAVAPCLIAGTPRQYRQPMSGRLINPADGRPLNYKQVENVQGFILVKKRVVEWVEKERKKRSGVTG
jgi:hypothetical protein